MSKEISSKEKDFICEQYGWYCPWCKYGYIYKDYEMPDDYEEWNCLLTRKDLENERKNKEKEE